MRSKYYLKQIAESKGVCPLTNEVKDNALLFPVGFEKIFRDLARGLVTLYRLRYNVVIK